MEEVYIRPNNDNDYNNNNNNRTTIYKKEIKIQDDDNKKLPFEFKRQLLGGANAPQFEPFAKTTNANPKKWEFETEIDEAVTKNINIHTITNEAEKEKTNSNTITTQTANEELMPEGMEELNTTIENNVKTKNKQTAKTKTKNKATPPTIQKFSSHIKFIDYIPTHEIITYRHLFAYGFYVE